MADEAAIEERLSRLRSQAQDLQSDGRGALPPPPTNLPQTGPSSALTMSDPDFMKQLARLKEEHMANLRVIERMYNEGHQAAGTLPMDDFAAASYVLPADSLSYSGERYEPPERAICFQF